MKDQNLSNPSQFAKLAALRRESGAKTTLRQPASPPKPTQLSPPSPAWQEIYLRWYSGELALPLDKHGNSVVDQVVMLPFPATPGNGTPGHQDVTLSAGQSWVLPLRSVIGTSYSDGSPPDQFLPAAFFETLEISFHIGHRQVIGPTNVMQYYSQVSFSPPITFDAPPASALVWVQEIGLLHGPLEAGSHKMKLDAKNPEPMPPNFGGGCIEFHNTWTIKVVA